MSEEIEEGDIVQVNINQACITLTLEAEVIHKPNATGDGWTFKDRNNNMTYHVTEGCTISRNDKPENKE